MDQAIEDLKRFSKTVVRFRINKLLYLLGVIACIKVRSHVNRIKLGFEIGANKQERRADSKDQRRNRPSPEREAADDGGHGGGAQRSQEPTADDRQNAGDAVNGSFTVPSTVSKR